MSQKKTALERYPDYEVIIGMEVHAQLTTNSKIFSYAANSFSEDPNAHIDPVCVGYPGTLPVLNKRVLEHAIMAGIATNCTINKRNYFARKHYFYPDLPKGYQITQGEIPICVEGTVPIKLTNGQEKQIGITRIHMEEDAGKNIHDTNYNRSLVDLNRAGCPLLEIVSEPDMRNAEEVKAYLKTLRLTLVHCGLTTGDMEKGAFRADTNLSVRKKGETVFGTKCELKNINSFKFIADAIEYEIDRQITLLENGESVIQETRLWDTKERKTKRMRKKEEGLDYRYLRDPDLPNISIDQDWIDSIATSMPELPNSRLIRLQSDYGITQDEADVLINDLALTEFFEEARKHTTSKKLINWILRDLMGYLNEEKVSLDACKITPESLAQLVTLIDEKTVNSSSAKQVFAIMAKTGNDPKTIIAEEGLEQVTDTAALEETIKAIIAANPKQVAAYHAGKEKLFGFFVGQTMKQTGGTADPQTIQELVKKHL
jgi:aspartyl-tRNA(Asn)/glutamyl-tRNA(Gln) amidotransferase subunit B